jgi:hypothetical protein
MSKTLAELRQSPRVGLPERTYSLCLASKLIGEVRTLAVELDDAMDEAAAQAEGDGSKARPRRAGESSTVLKIRKRMAALREEMVEHTGTLGLLGVDEGKWRAWVDEHPAREGNARDQQITLGYCNADDLLDDLGTYAKTWNGDDLAAGDWDWIKSQAAPGDLKELGRLVVSMHEMAVDVPKLLSDLLATPGGATG